MNNIMFQGGILGLVVTFAVDYRYELLRKVLTILLQLIKLLPNSLRSEHSSWQRLTF